MRALILPVALLTLLAVSEVSLADSSGPTLNPYRAYPPSCLADPLPATPSGPTISGRIALPLSSGVGTETVTISFWRSPCSDGKSALLGEVVRDQSNWNLNPAPLLPVIGVTDGTITYPNVRLAPEPNTIRSNIGTAEQLVSGEVFVFENWPQSNLPQFNYSDALTLGLISPLDASVIATATIPAYDPTQYADASQPMQISGYLSGTWYDPNHSREGMQVEVGEAGAPGTANNRFIEIAWYTYDESGTSYWLIGDGLFTAGDRSASVTLVYSTGGGFAGTFGNANTPTWGTVNVEFPDCNTMAFTYTSASGLPSGLPQGSGTKQWTRLTNVNGVTCE